jgi:predicted RNA-binding protein YlqC (UPF0109 family)
MESTVDKEFVSYIVKSIVDNPNDVLIERTVDEMGVLITLQVNPRDMGYVIGKSGSTAKAIRSLLRIVGARNNARVNLKILEPEQGVRNETRLPIPEDINKAVDDLDL